YILQNKSTDNTIIITTRELAKKCNVSTKTVIETLHILRDANLIETRTGAIMLNPKIAHRGSDGTERYLLQKFSIFSDESE
ncbi:replication/maintenance protein RepL, partial [Megasphaera elsdenii]|uniref:replication/maintenance protein RepL n=1 Tax=Megasphaera elsdenii TaxID=907 RepID=UPI003D05582E